MRGTGGNRFIPSDATSADLMRTINDQLGDLREAASESGRSLDLGEVTIGTRRVRSGRISVTVSAELLPHAAHPGRPAPDTRTDRGELT